MSAQPQAQQPALLREDRDGVATISSLRLADRYDLSSAQIRKDLATFGEFGVRGVGYSVRELRSRLTRILGLDRDLKVVILGAGNLGMALADYRGFNREGFRIVALFDNEYRAKSKWISVCVAFDKVLNANFVVREMLNFLLEPLAKLDDWLTPLDSTSGALVVYEK